MRYLPIYLTLIFSFLIGSHEGFVALWADPDEKPTCIFPYSVSSLPLADQQRLKNGIRLDSEEDLNRLLEDYLS